MKEREPKLRWGGNLEAQRQANEAFSKLKPKAKPAPKTKPKRRKGRGQFIGSYEKYLMSPQWARVRRRAIRRAGHRCEVCKSSLNLQVHHKHYRTLFRESLSDLTVLCKGCHANEHEDKGCRDPISAEFARIAATF